MIVPFSYSQDDSVDDDATIVRMYLKIEMEMTCSNRFARHTGFDLVVIVVAVEFR